MNSIEKALAVLRALTAPNGPHQLADLAERSGLTRPSVHRILQVLVQGNYAQARGNGLYAPGYAMSALVTSGDTSDDVARIASPTLVRLQHETEQTVHFAVRAGDAAVYLAKVEGDKPYQMASRVGMQIPLHCTSIGKAIIAEFSPAEVDELLERTSQTEQTGRVLPDRDALRRDLDGVLERGFSIDDEENERGVRCVGAAVRDSTGSVIGGISISGLAFLLDLDRLNELGGLVRTAAAEISERLAQRDAGAA
ncbi:IclR family transcriptional regulator [Aeromicrobium chenweiae]|nr:IclR family transcriptional regulator [Aeromicrobium chenweiae]